jgi:hypothetical protein
MTISTHLRLVSTLVLLLVPSLTAAGAEPKVIDRRADRKGPAQYSLVFMTRSELPGHAFVAFSEDRNSNGVGLCLVRAFGFYPGPGHKGVVGPVPGAIVDEAARNGLSRGEAQLIVRVDRVDYRKAEDIRRRWVDRTYQLTESDCITFSGEVAAAIGLKVPDRERTILPVDYVRRLAAAN